MFCANRFGFGREDFAKLVLAAGVAAIVLISCRVANAQVPGFTEPFRSVEVASAESGVITKVLVRIGDHVEVDQPVAELDSSIQQAQLDLAHHLVSAEAELRRAEAELQTKQSVFEHLQRLSEKGFAQEKELLRAQMELNVAKANSLSSKEHVAENKLRLQLAQISLDRRVIRAAVAGFVSEVHREPGEFISPVNPQVVTVVQVEPMVPAAIADYTERLSTKLREAVAALDEDRIRQEVGVFAAKIDVAEELARLVTHLGEVERVLDKGGAVGKRLDFLMQELNREANTLASKSVSAAVTAIALELKLLIEQMREQVQNLE